MPGCWHRRPEKRLEPPRDPRQQPLHPGQSLLRVVADRPELVDGNRDAQPCFDLAAFVRPGQGSSDIVVLIFQPVQPQALVWTAEFRERLLSQLEEALEVPVTDGRPVTRGLQLLLRILPDRVQHAVARLAPLERVRHNQGLVDQRRQQLEHLLAFDPVPGAHSFRGCQRTTGRKDRQPL